MTLRKRFAQQGRRHDWRFILAVVALGLVLLLVIGLS